MASYGIHGAVDSYADLPDASGLDLNTVFLVRQDAGAPSGGGLYWVQKGSGGKAWTYLDGLSMQTAAEVPYDNGASALFAANVQEAVDLLVGGGAALDTFEIHVDPVGGVDAPGRGGPATPLRTIAYAYGQIPELGNDEAALTQWNTEQVVFRLRPGEYDEGDVVLGLKRAHTVLRGQGAAIRGGVDLEVELTDIPTLKDAADGDGRTIAGSPANPWPLSGFPSPSLVLMGEVPSYDAGRQSRSFLVEGDFRVRMGDPLGTWSARIGVLYTGARNAYIEGGHPVTGLAHMAHVSPCLENCWLSGGCVGFDCDPAVDHRASMYLRARDCLIGGWYTACVIGSNVSIQELRGCWVNGLDKTYGLPEGWLYTSGDGIRDCRFTGDVFRFGGRASPRGVALDAVSFASLQARKAAGADWDDAQVEYALLDAAAGVAYDGADGQTGVWDGDAPADLQDAVQRIAVALEAQTGAPIA
jgi:hypothetical protein